MKKIIFSLMFFFTLTASTVTAQTINEQSFVANAKTPENISIKPEALNGLLTEYDQKADLVKFVIKQMEGTYYLLAKDELQNRIYAFNLILSDGKLYLDAEKEVNCCESDKLLPEIFITKDGKIVDCDKCTHLVFWKK